MNSQLYNLMRLCGYEVLLLSLVIQSIVFLVAFFYYRYKDKKTTRKLRGQLTKEIVSLRLTLSKAQRTQGETRKLLAGFLASGPHELRTPLQAILGLSELLQRSGLDEGTRKELSRLIFLRGNDLLYLLTNLIELTKIREHEFTLIKDYVYVDELFDKLQKEYQLMRVSITPPDKIDFRSVLVLNKTPIRADGARLQHVLICLLRNAIQFTKTGIIEVGCKQDTIEQMLLFWVSDTGIGIPRKYWQDIFLPFRKLQVYLPGSPGGAGLGLTVSKAMVEQWGGTLWIDSIEGRGSALYFTVPLQTATS